MDNERKETRRPLLSSFISAIFNGWKNISVQQGGRVIRAGSLSARQPTKGSLTEVSMKLKRVWRDTRFAEAVVGLLWKFGPGGKRLLGRLLLPGAIAVASATLLHAQLSMALPPISGPPVPTIDNVFFSQTTVGPITEHRLWTCEIYDPRYPIRVVPLSGIAPPGFVGPTQGLYVALDNRRLLICRIKGITPVFEIVTGPIENYGWDAKGWFMINGEHFKLATNPKNCYVGGKLIPPPTYTWEYLAQNRLCNNKIPWGTTEYPFVKFGSDFCPPSNVHQSGPPPAPGLDDSVFDVFGPDSGSRPRPIRPSLYPPRLPVRIIAPWAANALVSGTLGAIEGDHPSTIGGRIVSPVNSTPLLMPVGILGQGKKCLDKLEDLRFEESERIITSGNGQAMTAYMQQQAMFGGMMGPISPRKPYSWGWGFFWGIFGY